MLDGLTIAAVVGPAIGIVVWLVTRGAASGRIRRNGTVGIRTSATQASDAAWLAGHRAALRPSLVGMVALVAASAPAWFRIGDEGVQVTCSLLVAAVVVVEVVVVLVVSTRGAHRASGQAA